MRAVHKPKQAISNIRGTPSAYDTTTRFEDGQWQTYVITRCASCGKISEQHWNTGGADPRFVEKKYRGLGWHFDAFKPKHCICTDCIRPQPSEEPIMVKSNANAEVNQSGYHPPVNKGDTALVSMVGVTDAPVPRALTAHEKSKIRHLLDSHFDDARGRYLEGYDDRKIGEECDVPWAWVTEIREMAYGPLKEDPEVVAFKAEARALREEFNKMAKTAEEAVDKMHTQFKSIEGRLINIEAKAKKL